MLRKYPFHTFLIGVFPVLFIFTQNLGQTSWTDVLFPLVVIELVMGIILPFRSLYWVYALGKEKVKAPAIPAMVLVFFSNIVLKTFFIVSIP